MSRHAPPRYTRHVLGEADNAPANMNTFLRVGDVDGDGLPDVVVGGRSGTLAWFRNPGRVGDDAPWQRRVIEPNLADRECGGVLCDLTGSGALDVIVGGDSRSDTLLWWENPGTTAGPWTCRLIAQTGRAQFHDVLVGDVTGDGVRSLVFWNQQGEGGARLCRIPVPADPRIAPWPAPEVIAAGRRVAGLPEEGLALADLDGDGTSEIVAGTHWYKHAPSGWESHRFADEALGYVTTVVAVADVNGDGRPEIVLSEGDPCIYGRKDVGGRLAWFAPERSPTELWTEHRLAEGLWDAHSLQTGDLCGNGRSDLLVGEIGVRDRPERTPRLVVWENDGAGDFTPHVIDAGIGTHHAALADLEGRGRLDIVSRSLHGPDKWKIYAWRAQEA